MRSPAITATEHTIYVGVTATVAIVPLRFDRRYPLFGSVADITFAVGIAVGTFTLTRQVTVTLNIQAEAQESARTKDYGALSAERERSQHHLEPDSDDTYLCQLCAHKETSECCQCHCFCAITAWLITRVTCQMINLYCFLRSDIVKNYEFRIISLQMCSLCMCFSFCCKVLLRMQFGALGGLGRGVGVKHKIVQHCGALEWYIKTKILAVVTKTPHFPLQ